MLKKYVPNWQLLHEGSILVCLLSSRELSVHVSEEVQRAGWSGLMPVVQAEVFLKDGAAPEHCKLNSQSHVQTPVSGRIYHPLSEEKVPLKQEKTPRLFRAAEMLECTGIRTYSSGFHEDRQ